MRYDDIRLPEVRAIACTRQMWLLDVLLLLDGALDLLAHASLARSSFSWIPVETNALQQPYQLLRFQSQWRLRGSWKCIRLSQDD